MDPRETLADRRNSTLNEGDAGQRPCTPCPPCSIPSPEVPGGHIEGSELPGSAVDPEMLGSTASRAAAFQRNAQQGTTGGAIGSTASLNVSLDNYLLPSHYFAVKQCKKMRGLSIALSGIFAFCLVDSVLALSESLGRSSWQISTSSSRLASGGQTAIDVLHHYLPKATRGTLSLWEMVQITAVCGAIPGVWYLQRQLRRKESFTPSWKSTSKLNKGVAVNEDEPGGKSFHWLDGQLPAANQV